MTTAILESHDPETPLPRREPGEPAPVERPRGATLILQWFAIVAAPAAILGFVAPALIRIP